MDTTDGPRKHEGQDGELPFVDEHTIRIDASRELVWTALQRYVVTSLRIAAGNPLTKILRAHPPAGFEVSESTLAERLILVGRHRFSRYMLAFELIDAIDGTTQLGAKIYATFPGVRCRVYRTLVIGTRAHVIATNHILREIRLLTIRLTAVEDPDGMIRICRTALKYLPCAPMQLERALPAPASHGVHILCHA